MNVEPLQRIGSITSTNGAEIPAFDAASDRLFVVAGSIIEIQQISSTGAVTASGSLIAGFTLTAGTQALPNSVATKNGIVAVAYAIQNTTTNAQQPGRVSFYNAATGSFINSVVVGALPDMLTFTPDGTKVLVANEGEPNSYGQPTSFDPEGSVSIINIAGGVAAATVQTADFTSFNSQAAALKAAGVRIFGPGATLAQDLEPEYIAVSPDGLTAWVTLQENNAIAILDIATGKITSIAPLGAKNYNLPGNGIDASDRDLTASTGKIDIKNQPAFGLYQPDAIASFSIAGKAYYITANEGDARDYTGFSEEARVGATSYVLDPVKFPTAATLKQNANLGRLTVSTATGDTDGDGDFDRIESFGARSFSIWDGTGKQIFDSGEQLEQITAAQAPTLFNSDGTAATFDTRSDNKGPEPEGVVVGVINNRTYAFIGLERTGDVIVYDVTTPTQPQFVQYLNTPEDLGVEGLTFVSAADSPTGKPLLITAAEVSKTISVFEISLGDRSTFSASFIGQKTFLTGLVPTGAAGKIDGVDVPLGGLSGVAYDPTSKSYYAISDDRSQFGAARFYNFTLDPNTLTTTGVTFNSVTALKDSTGKTFALNSLDPEGIALSGKGTIFVSSEGEVRPDLGASRVTNPFIKEFSIATGQEIRSLTIPTKFLPKVADTNGNGIVDTGDTQTAGVRNNLAFESLTISPDQKTLYTATESALFTDGATSTVAAGTQARIVQFNLATGQPEKEYLYNADAIAKAPNPATGGADSGLVDLLAIDDSGTFLALERSFAVGQGNTIKIYEVKLQGATDISKIESLNSLTAAQLQAIAPAQKRLLINLDGLNLPNSDGNHPTGTDNIEGIAFGPKLADGRQSIVLVSDNNFSATQFTQILTLGTDLLPTIPPQAIVQSAFPNGVASGDTTQTSTVLWTLANATGTVTFEYSTKADFSSIAGTKTATATNPLQPVKVDVTGLSADTNYFYRVTDANGIKTNGKFSTAAALGQQAGLKFGVAGDWRGELTPYPAISNADTANLKFFIELGDTIYGDVASPAVKNPDGTEKAQVTTLAEYRAKHAEVYGSRFGQNTWGDLRAATSVFATIDDHEVTNDFAGGQNLNTSSAAAQALYGATSGLINDSPLYENGLQAFQEFNPIRDLTYSTPGDARTDGERKLYRANTFGNDAATFVLDARSFRDVELPDVTNLADQAQVGKFLVDSFDPKRTMLGKQQVDDLKRDLLQSQQDGVTWKFIMVPEPIQNIGVLAAADRFEGYAAERTEILKYINNNKIENVVFVAADIHGTLVNNLTYQNGPGQAQIATSAFEITTGSVAYSQPFGQTVAQLGAALGVITPQQKAFYDSLPTAGKDTFIKGVVDNGLQPLGYDPLGLDKNLSQANGLINAKLLQGDYVATHVYGWTEFNIDKQTQKLTATTYGIDPYTRAELEANPEAIINRQPKIVSQFEVTPNNVTPQLVSGTAGADDLVAGMTPGFDGFNDSVFTGAGNDRVDVPISGASAGNNRIDTGSGNDTVFVANGDRSFGSTGDDTFEANDAKDYRISAGAGNDTLFLGANGRALGGDGNDRFFVGAGGGNLLSGGAGADQFWIANAEIPSAANTILDFQIGTDVIGIQGAKSLGISATTLKLNQIGADTNIDFGGKTLAVLTGIQASSLTLGNSSQFVFA
ncbi:choice-of-anchor I family protein [Chamaesiphon sp.]|uniref:choice-of-anchor I family protein n=1 Tax=Chamaesiphon sp. TaxID=2814140 RepID=UPI003592FE5F